MGGSFGGQFTHVSLSEVLGQVYNFAKIRGCLETVLGKNAHPQKNLPQKPSLTLANSPPLQFCFNTFLYTF